MLPTNDPNQFGSREFAESGMFCGPFPESPPWCVFHCTLSVTNAEYGPWLFHVPSRHILPSSFQGFERLAMLEAGGVRIFFGHDPEFWKTVPQAPELIV
jgi:hypothetical protein